MPSFASSFVELREKVRGDWKISNRSVLVLDGKNTNIDGLRLDGHLIIGEAAQNVAKEDGQVPSCVPCEPDDPEYLRIRGFKLS